MAAIDALRKQWREEARFRPFRPYLYIDDEGLSLGAGTLLAPMAVNQAGVPGLALDGEEVRILATLSLGFRKSIPISALKFIRRASEQWSRGEKALAHFELAYARLPRFESPENARPLFFADGFVKLGISPRALMLARGLDASQLDLLKYSPDQPRVPAGNGRESGRWTDGEVDGSSSDSQGVNHPVEPHIQLASNDQRRLPSNLTEEAASNGLTADHPIDSLIQLAAAKDWRSLPVNLVEEEAPNGPGHAISAHVARTEAQLRAEFPPDAHSWAADFGRKREGSFDTIENANDLVNRTLRAKAAQVDRVASGQVSWDWIEYRFGFVTGYEVYRPNDKEFTTRKTYGVGVVIWHDASSPRGFRIRTAYPMNFD